jgi:catechol 2,3-dioxygenase-like lactoylglutathione lyase family enzyme
MPTPLKRVIIFVGDVNKCADFYRKVFGFKAIKSEHPSDEWLQLETGGCLLAFHKARGKGGPIDHPTGSPIHPHKIVFYAKDVKKLRATLIKRGAKMGKVYTFEKLAFCDGKDPEGHVFQISNR